VDFRFTNRNRRLQRRDRHGFLTVFPFDYPKVKLQDLQSGYILVKEQKNAIKLPGNGQTKIKISRNLKQDEQLTSIVISSVAEGVVEKSVKQFLLYFFSILSFC
jgi:hypothetical protein